jgi:hypothetical protein
MTPAQTTTRQSIAGHREGASKTPRCEHTLLTKPECHCRACLAAQIATHSSLASSS